MSLDKIMSVCFKYGNTVDGVDVLLHVACAVLTTGGTMILWKSFIFFLPSELITYVALGTVSLITMQFSS